MDVNMRFTHIYLDDGNSLLTASFSNCLQHTLLPKRKKINCYFYTGHVRMFVINANEWWGYTDDTSLKADKDRMLKAKPYGESTYLL